MYEISNILKLLWKSLDFWKLFLYLSFACILFIAYHIVKNIKRRSEYNGHLPGLKIPWYDVLAAVSQISKAEKTRNGYPLLAILRQLLAGHSKLFQNEEIVHLWFLYHPIVIANKAEAIKEIFTDPTMLNKLWFYRFLSDALGDGLATSEANKWKVHRKLLNPCMHLKILLDYLPTFNEQAMILVRKLLKENDDEIKELLHPISMCVVDITYETILGAKLGAQFSKNKEVVDSLKSVSIIFMERIVRWHLWPDLIFRFSKAGKLFYRSLKIAKDYTNKVLQQKKQEYQSGESQQSRQKHKSLMDLLLEQHMEKQTISEKDIQNEVDTFFAAANDTTSLAVVSALYFLGQDKEIQNKVHQELDRIFEGDKERPTYKEDLNEMKYTECVIKETMRLFPSGAAFGRRVPAGKSVCGYRLPEGATCIVVPYILHRDPEVFPDPEKFDPTRFFPENSAQRHPFAYIPFSAGPRDCIGRTFGMLEIKVILAALLRNFSVESLDPRDKLEHSMEIALRPSIPLRFRLKRKM